MIDHLVWILAGAFMVGLGKGGLSTVAALAVPFLALFMNPVVAAALLLPVFIVSDWFAVWLYRREYSARNIAILLPAILAGIAVATFIVGYAPERLLLAITGFVGLWACARSWLSRTTAPAADAKPWPGIFWGVVAGITTFITHSGAPPVQAYLLPQKLPRLVFAGTMAITFTITNLAKLPGYFALGYFDGLEWRVVAGLAIVGIAGTAAGRWIVIRLTDQAYVRFVEAMLFVLSLALFWKAFTLVMNA